MKLTTIGKFLALLALGCAALVSNANAAVLVRESFDYSNGNLSGKDAPVGGVWTAISGAGLVPIQVTGGEAVLVQGGGTREDLNVPFEGGVALGAGDVVYGGFHLTVPDPGAAVLDTYFVTFNEGASLFDARIWITKPTVGGSGFRLAISNDNSITDADGEVFSGDLNFGQQYRIVHKYDYDAKDSILWIDPVNELSPSISPSEVGFSDEVANYTFRQAGGNTIQFIDNLKVADNFGEAIPEPASLALLSLAVLGFVGYRRRHVS